MKANRNKLIKRLLEARAQRVLLLPHIGADGDAIGSSLAMARALKKMGTSADVITDEPVPVLLQFIPETDTIQFVDSVDLAQVDQYDLALLMDCHEVSRIGRRAPLYESARQKGTLDHHVFDLQPSDLDLIDITASSTAELVFYLVRELEAECGQQLFDKNMADQLMAGIISDTGRFSYTNVTARTFQAASELMAYEPDNVRSSYELFDRVSLQALRMKGLIYARSKTHKDGLILTSTVPLRLIHACGSTEYDLNTIPSDLRKVSDVAVVFLIRETAQPGEIRVNIRTDARLDAASLAKQFGGGGHARAAGLTIRDSSLQDAEFILIRAAERILFASNDN